MSYRAAVAANKQFTKYLRMINTQKSLAVKYSYSLLAYYRDPCPHGSRSSFQN